MKIVAVVIPEEILKQIDEKAKAENRSRSNFIREILTNWVNALPKEKV